MKNLVRLSLLSLFIISIAGCKSKITRTSTYTANVPVYMSYEKLRTSVVADPSITEMEQAGKIFLYNNYILINDFERGIHIYDNSDASNPVHVNFINIPGNVDIAVKNDILYADSYIDLVAIDISDPANPVEVGRTKNVLSYTISSNLDYNYPVSSVDQEQGVVVDFVISEVTEVCINEECGQYYYNNWELNQNWNMTADASTSFSGTQNNVRTTTAPQSGNGLAGSMARFMMVEDFLYVITDQQTVTVFNTNGGALPSVETSFKPWDLHAQNNGGWNVIETLFTFKGKLFIGSMQGMLIFDVESPGNPEYVSAYQHFTSCDPVVANDDFAFVTLRGGTMCGAFDNQLDVLDIKDIYNPQIIQSYGMSNPHGLGIDSEAELLFLCDGWDGLKVFSFEDPANISGKMLSHEAGITTFDVIAFRNIIHVIGSEGLHQYGYDNEGQLTPLSVIAIN